MNIVNKIKCFKLLAGLFILSSCQSDKNLQFKNHIKIGIEQKIKNFSPLKATAALDMRLTNLTFSSLVKLNSQLFVEGDLAKSWKYKNNVYTFFLKKNIFFSNGRPLNKEDILFSFEKFKNPECVFHNAFSVIKKVLIIKKNEQFIVKLFLKTASAKFLRADLPVLKILPKKEFLQNPDKFNKSPLGTGPYYISNFNLNNIELRPNTYSPKPGKTALLFKIVSDGTTRYQKLLKQDVDISFNNTDIIKVKTLQQNTNFKIYTSPGLSVTYLLLNLKNKYLSQIKVRQAIQSSLNVKDIIKYKLKDFADPASSLLNPNHLFFNKKLNPASFDLKKTKQLLKSLNVKSLSVKNLSVKNLTLKVSNKLSSINFGKILSQQIKLGGVDLKLKSLEWGVLYKNLKNSQFDIALMSWSGVVDPDIYRIAFHSQELPPGRNRSLYTNQHLDRLLNKGIYTLNLKKRKKIYNQVQKIIAKDIAIIPLWHKKQIIVANKSILGLSPSLTEGFEPLINVYKKN